MSDQERRWLEELSGCTFPPGSWDQRFVRSLSIKPDALHLTETQRQSLLRLRHKYRRQIQERYAVALQHYPFRTGGHDLRANVWAHYRDTTQRLTTWTKYALMIRRRFGTQLKAMNPDGTWRPWSPSELDY